MTDLIGFILTAAFTVLSALFVVCNRNLVQAVLSLALMLIGTAVLYGLLDASFLAGVQVLTYVGGVVTLCIFGVMVSRRLEGTGAPTESQSHGRAFVAAALIFGIFVAAVLKTDLPASAPQPTVSIAQLGQALLGKYLLAFEALSLLLLAAIIGAVVLARRRDPDPATGREPGVTAPREELP
jgi:NADH-quinone oxidoreductase subunit J